MEKISWTKTNPETGKEESIFGEKETPVESSPSTTETLEGTVDRAETDVEQVQNPAVEDEQHKKKLKDIGTREQGLSDLEQRERTQLAAAREKLGIQSTEESHALRSIGKDKVGIEQERKEAKEAQERIFKKRIANVAEAGGRIARALQNRNTDRLSLLMGETSVSRLTANLRGLHELSRGAGSVSPSELTDRLQAINTSFEELGRPSRAGQVREDQESLNRIVYGFKSLYQETGALQNSIALEGNQDAFNAAERLKRTSDEKGVFVARLRSSLY